MPISRLTSAADANDGVALLFSQAAMREHLESCGFEYLVSDDADVVIEALKAAGILRGGFSRITHQGQARNHRANMGGGAVTATATGGQPMIAPNQGLVIKMFKDADPQGTNALPARDTFRPGLAGANQEGQYHLPPIECMKRVRS